MTQGYWSKWRTCDLVAWSGASESTVAGWKNGERGISLEHLLALLNRGDEDLQADILKWLASKASAGFAVIPAGELSERDLDLDGDGSVTHRDLILAESEVTRIAAVNSVEGQHELTDAHLSEDDHLRAMRRDTLLGRAKRSVQRLRELLVDHRKPARPLTINGTHH